LTCNAHAFVFVAGQRTRAQSSPRITRPVQKSHKSCNSPSNAQLSRKNLKCFKRRVTPSSSKCVQNSATTP